jgi:hypothetical protein
MAHWLFWQNRTSGEDEGLVDVTLRGRAVPEVGDDRGVPGGVTRADQAVALDTHRVAGRVQRVRADDERVQVEVVRRGVPAAVVDATEQAQQVREVDTARVRDPVLAIGREHVVLGGERPAGADLGGFLAQALRPQTELALPLQRGGLGVEGPHEHHVAVHPAQGVGVEVGDERAIHGMLEAHARWREQLDEAVVGERTVRTHAVSPSRAGA